jgi:hypothetical protein
MYSNVVMELVLSIQLSYSVAKQLLSRDSMGGLTEVYEPLSGYFISQPKRKTFILHFFQNKISDL